MPTNFEPVLFLAAASTKLVFLGLPSFVESVANNHLCSFGWIQCATKLKLYQAVRDQA